MKNAWRFAKSCAGRFKPAERNDFRRARRRWLDADADSRTAREKSASRVSEACLAPLTFASHAYDDFHLLMPLYICRRWDGEVIAREGQNLAWVRANKLRDYPMPPADIPLIPHLIDLLM